MNDQIKERLSAFMDGESHDQDVIGQLHEDQEALATWSRYHLIRDVLHQNYVPGTTGLSAQIAMALQDEPTVLAPRTRSRKLLQHASGWAIAATIAAVAILVVRQPEPLPDATPLAIGPITQQPVRLTAAAESKLSSYLVSHNESSASSRMKGVLPYTRIVSFTPGQSVPQQAVVDAQK